MVARRSIDVVADAVSESPQPADDLLAAREPHPDLRSDPALPDDTRLWAALQNASGGTWGGCVFDLNSIVKILEKGMESFTAYR